MTLADGKSPELPALGEHDRDGIGESRPEHLRWGGALSPHLIYGVLGPVVP